MHKNSKIDFMSTPYSFEDVDFLMKLNVDAFKIASGQLTELQKIFGLCIENKKPIFLSTGMSQLWLMLNLLLILFLKIQMLNLLYSMYYKLPLINY